MKIIFHYIRKQRLIIFLSILLIYVLNFLTTFLNIQGYDFSNDGIELNIFNDDIKISNELYNLVEFLTSEEEKENKNLSNPFFDISENCQRLNSNINSCQLDLPQQTQFTYLNKTPKYLLFHQLKIYSESLV